MVYGRKIAHGGRMSRALISAVVAALLLPVTAGVAAAAPTAPAESHLDRIEKVNDRQLNAYVYSASMDKEIALQVIRPADTSVPRPTLYLLGDLWQEKTDAVEFFRDKNVNVVMPLGGAYTYYADWQKDDPALGRNKWVTFLNKELPPIVDAEFGTNGVNSVAGLSMAATSVLSLAIDSPGLYKSVGSYSGCASTSDPLGQAYVRSLVEMRGGGDTENMWGTSSDPAWAENDPYVRAAELRGTAVYISNGSGLPGPYDTLASQDIDGDVKNLVDRVVVGGLIEAATNMCTQQLTAKLNDLRIPHTFKFRMDRTHAWAYWQDDLHDSWPMFAASMGL